MVKVTRLLIKARSSLVPTPRAPRERVGSGDETRPEVGGHVDRNGDKVY